MALSLLRKGNSGFLLPLWGQLQSWQGSYFIPISSTLDHSAWILSSVLSSLTGIRWISMQINSRAKVWGSDMPAKQKIRLYNSCVVSVLLDAAKTWGITQADKKRFDAFDSRCLGGISNVKWHHYVRNIEFQERTRKEKIVDFLTRRWLPWSHHSMSTEWGWRVGEGLVSWVCSSWVPSPTWDSSKGWGRQ